MPVITRSMTAHGSKQSDLVLSSSARLTCDNVPDFPTTNITDAEESILLLPDLVDQSASSESSIDSDDSSTSSSSSDGDFQISEFSNLNFEISSYDPLPRCVHFSNSSPKLKMESDCVDQLHQNDRSPSTNHDSPTNNQDSIMQMLSLISNQMMTSYQDLQEKLVQTELKFSQELQRVTTENRLLKQEIHSVMQNTLSTSRSGDRSTTTILVPTQAGSASTSTVPPVSASVPTSSPAVSSASN